MKFNFDSINAARARSIRNAEDALIQSEVRLAKQIQAETGCNWTEALKRAYAILRERGSYA